MTQTSRRYNSRQGKKNKIQNPKTLADIYDFYVERLGDSKAAIPFNEFKRIAVCLLNNIMEYIIYESGEVSLTCGLGPLRIRKVKTKSKILKRDFKLTHELGRSIYHLNLHTKGYHVRFYWQKYKGKITGITPYSFIPNWHRKKELSKSFSGGQDYLE